MSWLFGLISDDIGESERGRLRRIHGSALHCVEKPNLYLAAGGLAETCLAGTSGGRDDEAGGLPETAVSRTSAGRDGEAGWLMVGLGIRSSETSSRFVTSEDVGRFVSTATTAQDDLDGHYILAHWSRNQLVCRSDPLGLRTLYVLPGEKGTYISTRLDWLAKAAGGLDIDFSAFGSHWLGANQYSFRSLVGGVERLGPGCTVTCTSSSVQFSGDPWSPSTLSARRRDWDPAHVLRPYLRLDLPEERRLSLGLSGGLDSRTLLAILLGDESSFMIHIFGDREHPDARVAARIAQEENLAYEFFAEPAEGTDEIFRELADFAAVTNAIAPASTSAKLRVYPQLHRRGLVCIDGFFGEIARRQYFNRVLALRGRAFSDASAEELLPRFYVDRPQFFSGETQRLMHSGMRQDLEDVLDWRRSLQGIADEDFADLLAIRYRLPNFSGYEQARLDGRALTYMPFAQRRFLDWALQLPLRQRKNGRAFRRCVRKRRPSLSRYPLVKGGVTYPFALPTLPAWIWTNLKARIGLAHRESERRAFLASIEEYVRDTVRSHRVRSFGAYDFANIAESVESYYNGDESQARFVDWWIAFEAWRKSLGRE